MGPLSKVTTCSQKLYIYIYIYIYNEVLLGIKKVLAGNLSTSKFTGFSLLNTEANDVFLQRG